MKAICIGAYISSNQTQRSAVTPYAMVEAVPFGSIVFEEDSIWPLSRTSHVVSVGPRSKCRIDPSDDARSPFRQYRIVDWPSRRQPSSHPVPAFPEEALSVCIGSPIGRHSSLYTNVSSSRGINPQCIPIHREHMETCTCLLGNALPMAHRRRGWDRRGWPWGEGEGRSTLHPGGVS